MSDEEELENIRRKKLEQLQQQALQQQIAEQQEKHYKSIKL